MKTLSDKIWYDVLNAKHGAINTEDVKDFLKQLKERISRLGYDIEVYSVRQEIDKLVGDKLIW